MQKTMKVKTVLLAAALALTLGAPARAWGENSLLDEWAGLWAEIASFLGLAEPVEVDKSGDIAPNPPSADSDTQTTNTTEGGSCTDPNGCVKPRP